MINPQFSPQVGGIVLGRVCVVLQYFCYMFVYPSVGVLFWGVLGVAPRRRPLGCPPGHAGPKCQSLNIVLVSFWVSFWADGVHVLGTGTGLGTGLFFLGYRFGACVCIVLHIFGPI